MALTGAVIKMVIGSEEVIFRGMDIISATIVREVNPLSLTVPISTIEFSVFTTDIKYSIFSDGTYYQSLSKMQPIQAFEEIDGIDTFLGDFYLDEWEYVSESEFRFKGIDIIGAMNEIAYDGGFWSADTPINTVLSSILDQSHIPYMLVTPLETVTVRGWIPPGTVREAIQQVCFAAGATVTPAPNWTILLFPVKLPYRGLQTDITISKQEKTWDHKLRLLPIVTKIELVSHEYSKGTELVNIYTADLEPGDYKVVFTQPYYSVDAEGVGYIPISLVTEDGASLVTEDSTVGEYTAIVMEGDFIFGSNCLYLSVFSPGTVTVTGYPWVDSQRGHIFNETDLIVETAKNELKVDAATLINIDNAELILGLMRDYYRQRYEQESVVMKYTVRYTYYGSEPFYGEGVYREAPPQVNYSANIASIKDKQIDGLIERMEYDLAGGFLIKTKIVGVQAADA